MDDVNTTQLPPELQDALQRFQRRWKWISLIALVGMLALIPLLSFLLLFLSDRIWDTPQWARWTLALPVPMLMVWTLTPFVRRWLLQPPDAAQLARAMGRIDRRVGDRLLGAVELSEGADTAWAGSPALRKAAIAQVTGELSQVHAEEKLDPRPARKRISVAGALCLLALGCLVVAPHAAENSLLRWLAPYRALDRFTFVRFSGFPDEVVVPHGEAFVLEGSVTHVDEEPVEDVRVNVDGPESVELTREGESLALQAEGFTTERSIRVSAGDARSRTRVRPKFRPELVGVSANILWPSYLEREPTEVALLRRRLEVPIGSEVALRAEISREVERVLGTEGAAADGHQVLLPEVLVEEDHTLAFGWVDVEGLRPREPAEVVLVATPDRAPLLSLSGISRAVAILEDEFLEMDLRAQDDFGLKRVWATFKERNPEMEDVTREVETAMTGESGTEQIQFSPERLGFGPGSRLDLIGYATDAFPDREPSETARYRILVLSREEHAKLVLQQMDRVLEDLDESIRQEALALEEMASIAERSPEDLMDPSTDQDLQEQALDEQAREEQVEQTRNRMERLIAEATKNEQIGDQQIGEWAKITESLRNAAQPSMSAAASSMQQASTESSEQERREQIAEAIEQQQKALDAMRQGEEDLNESIENSLSESFLNRFRELAERERSIGDELGVLLPQTIGLPTELLEEGLKTTLLTQADTQKEVTRDTRYIANDLEGFFIRTQNPVLRVILDEMDQENHQERLSALEALIRRNTIGLSLGEAQAWTTLYERWAKLLEDAASQGQGQGEGQGGSEDEGEDLETMIALIRGRERQEVLRRQTRALDETYATNMEFHREAVVLAERQYEISRELQVLENRVKKDETKQLVSIAAGEMMNAGVRLRRPDTGQETIAIQTEVIERIAQALDQSMGNQDQPPSEGPQSPQQNNQQIMQAIQMMMQNQSPGPPSSGMAGQQGGEGQTGSGNPGESSGTGTPGRISLEGRGSESGRGAGVDPSSWPGQYRGLMDAYFEAVEESP